ncbi:MAG: NAD-dependent malic enzyme [Candidatus Kapaibacteriota bacterium]
MKLFSYKVDHLTNEHYVEVYIKGPHLMNNALLNKGAAFSLSERIELGLDGLIRDKVLTIEEQVQRTYDMYLQKNSDLEKYIFLQSVLNRNETLFYNLLQAHLKEMLPIVYTPTVGQACMLMSHILRKFRGIYITEDNIDRIDQIFQNVESPEIYLIVVTDGERILGLGDLGSDGMGIPVGKVNLYVSAAGLNPAGCLPITLDVGTNCQRLLDDPLYLGVHKKRLHGEEYDRFIEKFVLGVKRNFPNALLQWEDFGKQNAFKILERYQKRILSFNDDIQGTGAVLLAALYSAMKLKKSSFNKERFVVVGLGQAGSGVCFNITNALREEGLTDDEIKERIFAIDIDGLVLEDMPNLEPQMKIFAQKRENIANWKVDDPNHITFEEVIKNAKPTVLIGATAQAKLFNDKIIQEVAKNTERPIFFALSNPTSQSECTPEDVYYNTKGKGIVATGSPFEPIEGEYGKMYVSQSNNMYIFPGVGLGALVAKAPFITYKMFLAASKRLSELVTDQELEQGKLLPEMDNIREISAQIAIAVAKEARDSGIGRIDTNDNIEKFVRKAQWDGKYKQYKFKKLEY